MSLKIEFSAASDAGKVRKNNEDSFLLAPELELAIVADGMGGHSSGEVASSLGVKVTRDEYKVMSGTGLKPNPYNDKLCLVNLLKTHKGDVPAQFNHCRSTSL